MKKIFTLSVFALFTALLLTSCVRTVNVNTDENYWLTQERGDVVYSDSYCGYYVVETAYGYTILRAVGNGLPYENDVMYGNFGNTGTRNFYNRSAGIVVSGQVVEYDLTYTEAQYALEYYCPYYGKGTDKKTIKNSGAVKIKRPGSTK